MSAALYAFAAVAVAYLSTRAWMGAPDHEARRVFLGLGWSLFFAWLGFALSLLPGLSALRGVWTVAGVLAAAFAWWTVDRLCPPTTPPRSSSGRRLVQISGAVGAALAAAHLIGWRDALRASPPEVLAGIWALGLSIAVLRRLSIGRHATMLASQRARLGWLMASFALAIVLSAAEWLARTLWPVLDPHQLPFLERGLTLQGALPPASAVAATFGVYLIYHAVRQERFIALQEAFGHLVVAITGASVLLVAHAATLGVIALGRFPLHGGFSLFLLSAVWLSAWQPIREHLLRRALAWLRHPGPALEEALTRMERALPGTQHPDVLASHLVAALHGSGRTDAVGVWLLEDHVDGYQRRDHRGPLCGPELVGLDATRRDQLREPRLRAEGPSPLLDLLESDVIIPLRDGQALLGWIAMRPEVYSEGFTRQELDRLLEVGDLAGRVLGNVHSLARMAEEQRLASIGTLAAGLAHEIRNPLAGLKGAAQVLGGAVVQDEDREMLEIVVSEADRLDRVVGDFLDYARPIRPQVRPTPVEPLLCRAVRILTAGGDVGRRAVDVAVAPPLTSAPVDPDPMIQVLLNLLRNAIHATSEDGRISLHASLRPPRHWALTITDDGPGLPPEVRGQLFTPFTTTRSDGTGLGLAISQRIVEAHGGRIDASEPASGGARFTILLPIDEAHPDEGSGPIPGT